MFIAGEQRLKIGHEIGLGTAAAYGALHFAADDIESGDQGLRAMADILELAPLRLSRPKPPFAMSFSAMFAAWGRSLTSARLGMKIVPRAARPSTMLAFVSAPSRHSR